MAITIFATPGKAINLGRAGENLATTVKFYVKDWMDEFGVVEPEQEVEENNTTQYQGLFTLFVQQNGIGYYVQSLVEDEARDLEGDYVEWNVTSANTATVGMGKCELQYIVNEVIVKSIIYDIIVTTSLDVEAQGDIPDPIESWLNEVSQMTQQIANASEYADLAERYAKGTSNEAAVQEGTAGYHDNSKYYKELAESANTAAQSAKTAAEAWATGGSSGTPSATNNAKYYSDRYNNMTVEAEKVGPLLPATATITTVNGHYNIAFEIPQGDGLHVSGYATSGSNLPTASQHSNEVYLVGSEPGYYYYSDGADWINCGPVGGLGGTLYTWS